TGSVVGRDWCNVTGGLVGRTSWGCRMTNCYATGNVSGGDSGNIGLGGFVGQNSKSTITNCYASGRISVVSRPGYPGGFAGESREESSIASWTGKPAGCLVAPDLQLCVFVAILSCL
ncbi:MAG: hypothetical protein JSW66_13565, partial [Phycisphaerales bacterium]